MQCPLEGTDHGPQNQQGEAHIRTLSQQTRSGGQASRDRIDPGMEQHGVPDAPGVEVYPAEHQPHRKGIEHLVQVPVHQCESQCGDHQGKPLSPGAQPVHQRPAEEQLLCRRSQNTAQQQIQDHRLVRHLFHRVEDGGAPGRLQRSHQGQGGDHKAHAAVCQPGGRHPLHQSQDGILYRHLEDHQCCQGPAHPGKSPPCLPGLLIPLEKRPYLLHMLPPPDSLRLERVGAPTAVQALFIEWPWNPLPRGAWR